MTGVRHVRGLSTFRVGAVVILVAVLAIRLWSIGQWSWMLDDWVYMERSRSMSLPAFLFQNYNGHVMPGEFLVVRIVTGLAPLWHPLAVAVTAVGCTAAAAVWAFALRELCGERLRTLVPLLLLALTPLQVPATMWWASALQTVSVQLALGGCVYYGTRLARGGRRADRVGLLLSFALGLVMWEKAVLLLVPIAALLLYLAPRDVPGRLRRVARELGWLGAVSATYAVFYVLVVFRTPSTAPTPVTFDAKPVSEVARSFRELVGHLLAPGLLGGPWGSLPTDAHVQARPAGVVVVLSVSALLAAVLIASSRCRSPWLPLGMVVTFGMASWGLIVFSRLGMLEVTKVGYERYAVDIFTVLCLALSLFLSPEAQKASPADLRLPAVVPVLVVLALVGSTAAADALAVRRIGRSPAGDWVQNVTSDVHRLGPVSVVDAIAPDDVLFGPFWGDHARLSRMLAPLGDEIRFDRPGSPMYVVSERGRLVPAAVVPAVRSRPGPDGDCGYAVAPGKSVPIVMTGTIYPYRWGIQVNAFAGRPGVIAVDIGGHEVELRIRAGLNAPQAVVVGPVDTVRIRSVSGSEVICVTDVIVGSMTASPER